MIDRIIFGSRSFVPRRMGELRMLEKTERGSEAYLNGLECPIAAAPR
jgi:hypothetical protein